MSGSRESPVYITGRIEIWKRDKRGIVMNRSAFWVLVAWWVATNADATDEIISKFVIEATQENGIGPSASKINALICRETAEISKLVKHASKNYVAIFVTFLSSQSDVDRLWKTIDRHRDYYVLDLDCPGAMKVLQKANSTGMFEGPNRWLLLTDSRTSNDSARGIPIDLSKENGTINFFQNLAIFPDSDVVIGQRVARDFVKLVSIYRPSPVRSVLMEDRGYWRAMDGIHLNPMATASARRKDLQKTPLKSCLVCTDPDSVNHLTDFHDTHIDPIAKANYPWVLFLVESMNATVTFDVLPSWGYCDNNGTWNGMMGMLQRHEIDLGGTALFLTLERLDIVHYISLYTPTSARFVFRRPPLSYVSNVFSLPFRPSVWLASGGFLVLVTIFLYVAATWEWKSASREEREKPHWAGTMIRLNWSENLLVILGAVSQQGSVYEPRRVSSRIIILMLFMAVISLHTSYTANIVALLQSSTNSINNLEKLLQSSLTIGVHDTVYNRHYFGIAQDPIRKAIYERKVVPKGQKEAWMSVEDGVHLLRQGLFAFHGETGPIYKTVQETFLEEEKCGLQEIDYLNVLDPMLAIPKRSPYMEILRVGALKIRETGLQARFVPRIYTRRPVCNGQSIFVSVGLIDCFAAFAALAYGTGLSLILLLTEICWVKRKKSSMDNDMKDMHFTSEVAIESQVQEVI